VSLEGRSAFRRESAGSRSYMPPRPKETMRPQHRSVRPRERTRMSAGEDVRPRTRMSVPPSRARRRPPHGGTVADLLTQGVETMEAGRPASALPHFARAAELDPLSAELHLCLGIAYHQLGDGAAAVQALRAAVLLDPELWLASFYLGLNYEKLGRARDAKR